jgi:glucose-6-phosphate 1-dehydrogenase
MSDAEAEPSYCDLSDNALVPQAAVIVVFGATGDLARRKIYPALYNLERAGLLPAGTEVVGFARRELGQEAFLELVRESCALYSVSAPLDEVAWDTFSRRVSYLRGSFEDDAAYRSLAARLAAPGAGANANSFANANSIANANSFANALFYLAVAPEEFSIVARQLARAGLGTSAAAKGPGSAAGSAEGAAPFRRLVVEKPFGSDRLSARELNATLQDCFAEEDIFRIDHYLGKETVQNLLYFRFANSIFEPLWNRNHIESVEIDVLETGGIGTRGGYYDKAGAARDMLQNHLVQLLCLVAMEPPASLGPEAIRSEKVKVLKSIRDYSPAELLARSVRGQYAAGRAADGSAIRAYVDEARVAPGSTTETFASIRLEVDNWRFAGVPFTLRTGKALDRQVSEVRVNFKRPPAALFQGYCGDRLSPNALTLRIQPDEGMWLRFNVKEPGAARVAPRALRFAYREADGAYFPEAYERLIADALAGDSTLFIRADEADEAWRILDALESAWASVGLPVLYPAGSPPPA